jgi:hypothetical protein
MAWSHNLLHLLVASVAQLVEQLTLNQLVPGSSPGRGTSLRAAGFSSNFLRLTPAIEGGGMDTQLRCCPR